MKSWMQRVQIRKLFFNFLKKIVKIYHGLIFWKRQKITSVVYYQYADIPLRVYFDIIESRNVLKVCKSGIPDLEKAAEAWEDLIRQNSEANGSFEYENYLTNVKTYGLLINEYLWIKGALSKLLFKVDKELIEELKRKGYKVSINPLEYTESLIMCFRKVENLLTKTQSKAKEIEGMKGEPNKESFDSIMANLSYHWPGHLPEDITLARFNECIKILKRGRAKQAGHLAG